jgi:hypothetical protein
MAKDLPVSVPQWMRKMAGSKAEGGAEKKSERRFPL